jgi:SOS-response transcriptional repressor LexA
MPTPAADRPPLTDRQAECLAIIRKHWLKHGCSPTTRYICDQMGMSGSPEGAMAHIRPLVRKGYLRAVEGHRSGAKTAQGNPPRAYVLTDTEIVLKRKGSNVRIVLTGPEVVMTREEWRKWLLDRLEDER